MSGGQRTFRVRSRVGDELLGEHAGTLDEAASYARSIARERGVDHWVLQALDREGQWEDVGWPSAGHEDTHVTVVVEDGEEIAFEIIADVRADLVTAAQEWHEAEIAYAEERARYVSLAWGDPPTWGEVSHQVLDDEALARLKALGLAAAAAAAEYEGALGEFARQA